MWVAGYKTSCCGTQPKTEYDHKGNILFYSGCACGNSKKISREEALKILKKEIEEMNDKIVTDLAELEVKEIRQKNSMETIVICTIVSLANDLDSIDSGELRKSLRDTTYNGHPIMNVEMFAVSRQSIGMSIALRLGETMTLIPKIRFECPIQSDDPIKIQVSTSELTQDEDGDWVQEWKDIEKLY